MEQNLENEAMEQDFASVPVEQNVNESNGMAIASLVLGILGFLGSCCYGGILGIPGLILGIIALKKGQSKGMAIAGIVLSVLSIVISVAIVVIGLAVMGNSEYQEILKQAQSQQIQ